MMGTFRPEAMGLQHPLLVLRRRLTREGLAKPLRLSRLSPAAVEAMVVEMSGAGEAALPLAGRLYQETEGNPFFLMEIVKALFEIGVIHLEGGVWRGDFFQISEGELPLPAGVSEAIRARVQRLNEESQDAVRLAAVLGREFDFDLLNPRGTRMAESSPVPPVSTFVVRFWQEWSAAGPRWRGRIEHVQSGECATFLGPDAMLDFIRSFGTMADDASQSTKQKGAD